jgi:hypothetical protein
MLTRRLIVMALLLSPMIGTASHPSAALERTVPAMTAADLNGRTLNLPQDMAGDPAVWVVAFDRAHQDQVDRLFQLIDGAKDRAPGVVYWEVPVIKNPGAIGRWFIDNGMRSGIPNTQTRSKVVTLYVPDRAKWLSQMGVGGTDQAYAVVVGRSGAVLATAAQSDIKTVDDMAALIEQGHVKAPVR